MTWLRYESSFENLTKTITQKGNAHLGLGQFDEAKECYESLRELGETSSSDLYLKKLAEAQERVWYLYFNLYSCKINNKISSTEIDKTNNQAWRIDHIVWTNPYNYGINKINSSTILKPSFSLSLLRNLFTDNKRFGKYQQSKWVYMHSTELLLLVP